MTEISVVLPSYHEAENLENILPVLGREMNKIGKEYEILVIDTMESTDNTEEICQKNGVSCKHRENGNFYGDAIRTGISQAKGKYLVIMDADGSHDPEVIPKMYDVMISQNAGLVIGSRYCRSGSTENNIILRLMSWVLNVTYRVMFGLHIKDVSDSFRMYKTDMLRSITLECDNFDIVEEILIRLHCRFPEEKIIEIPIRFSKRAAGTSKRNLFKFILSYIKTMKRLLRIKSAAGKEHKR